MLELHTQTDPYGKAVVEGRTGLFTERRLRKLRQNNKNFVRVPKNGLYDPVTYYHFLDMLCRIRHHVDFDAKELTKALNEQKPQFIWDNVTVGRILGDIWESLEMASPRGQEPIKKVNHSGHRWYSIQRYPHTDTMLVDTLLDMAEVCKTVKHDEAKATTRSPLEFVAWLNPVTP